MLAASATSVRILDGAREIARHRRSYNRQEMVLDPEHQQALLRTKRKAIESTRSGRLELVVPESAELLERAFADGESAPHQIAHLLQLLDRYGAAAMRALFARLLIATRREPPRSSSCCARPIAQHRCRSTSDAIRKLRVSKSAPTIWRPTMNSLNDTTKTRIRILTCASSWSGSASPPWPRNWMTCWLTRQTALVAAPVARPSGADRSGRACPPQSRTPLACGRDQEVQTHGRLRMVLADAHRTRCYRAGAYAGLPPRSRNLVLVGANGLGKTMIAQNICHAAVLAGHSVLFRTASKLLTDLHRQTSEGRLRKLRSYANVGLLCIDEVGYLSFDDKSADLLYEVINQRYEQKSLILTTNKPFKEWNEVFPNAACIATMLDRLLHHAEVTVIEGSSYRVRESEQEATARRRRKR